MYEQFVSELTRINLDPIMVAERAAIIGFCAVVGIKLLLVRSGVKDYLLGVATLALFVLQAAFAIAIGIQTDANVLLAWAAASLVGALVGAFVSFRQWRR